MTDNLARTIAALRSFLMSKREGVSIELYGQGRSFYMLRENWLALCAAAERGLCCPPREPRIGTPERLAWQDDKNVAANAALDALVENEQALGLSIFDGAPINEGGMRTVDSKPAAWASTWDTDAGTRMTVLALTEDEARIHGRGTPVPLYPAPPINEDK